MCPLFKLADKQRPMDRKHFSTMPGGDANFCMQKFLTGLAGLAFNKLH